MLKNPLSPHLSIYKMQLTSVTSIVGRLCGIYTYLFIITAMWLVIISVYRFNNPTMPLYMAVMLLKTSSPFLSVVYYALTFVTAFCCTFFTCTMVRHIMWDHDIALSLRASQIIGIAIIALSIIVPTYTVVCIAII